MAKTGRPSSYNQKTADAIVEALLNGTPLKKICAQPDMPAYVTVLRWQDAHPEFRNLSARAKADGSHGLADECLIIADDETIDPANKRIMIDTRIRLIGKWNSRAYGEKLELSNNPDAPFQPITVIEHHIIAQNPTPTDT